jgi:hypothetical protein
VSTPAAALSHSSVTSEDTAPNEGLTLAELLDVLGTETS